MRRAALTLSLVLLFFAGVYRQSLGAAVEIFGGDETTDIAGSFDTGFGALFLHGPAMELNASPLHYVLGRAQLAAAGFAPQLHWEPRFFFRLLPMCWWSLACVAACCALYRLLRREKWPESTALLTALGASVFLFANHFPLYYSVISRPYSLWLLLSLLHLLLFLRLFSLRSRLLWACYAAVSLLLPLTAYVSILQVAAGTGVLLLLERKNLSRRELSAQLALFSVCALTAAWYLAGTYRGSAPDPRVGAIFAAFLDLLTVVARPFTSSFHTERNLEENWAAAGILLRAWSMLIFFAPLCYARRKELRPFLLYAYGLSLSLLAVSLVLFLKGQMIGSVRYLLFLFPCFLGFALLTLRALSGALELALKRRLQPVLGALLATWLGVVALRTTIYDIQGLFHHTPDLLTRAVWWPEPRTSCPAALDRFRNGKNGIETEPLRELCRP